MNGVRKTANRSFYWLLLPLVVGFSAWQGWAWWSWASGPVLTEIPSSSPTAVDSTKVRIHIAQGTSAQQIGRDLEDIGAIRSATAWDAWYRWKTLRDRNAAFKAGTYEVSPANSMPEIAAKIQAGQVVQQSFTIPEGWSLEQMARYFEDRDVFSAEAFLEAAQNIPYQAYPWLPPDLPHLEGFLYPDTYQFPEKDLTPQIVIEQMLAQFQQVALPVYQENRQSTSFSFLEWVTLASIVEKEVVVTEERDRIAAVFAKRLRENIPLGADPTVEYGLKVSQTPDRPLTLRQVNTPSPYNTYLNPGLPPTPIASPGLANLKAALNPSETDYLYFVARYDGTHIFSRTLAEHESAQAAIRQERQAGQRADSPTPSASPQ